MFMQLLGNQLNRTIFLWLQHLRNLTDVEKLIHQQFLTKMNGDRPYFEARYTRKKVKGDFDYDGPQNLTNLSLMWGKMAGYRQGIFLECNGRTPREMVKGAVTCVKTKP